MESKIQFANEKVEEAFKKLNRGKYEEERLYEWILRAFNDLKGNPFCGIQIPRRLMPKYYIQKYNVKNLWKYNLPDAWRLMYSIETNQISIISIVLEWLDHKEYERRFRY